MRLFKRFGTAALCIAAGIFGMWLYLVVLHVSQDHQALHQLVQIELARQQAVAAPPATAPAPAVPPPPAAPPPPGAPPIKK